MKALKFFVALTFLITSLKAQTVYELIEDPTLNYYDVVNKVNDYFKTHSKGKGRGYKMFKRWEAEMKYWIDEQGNRINPTQVAAAFTKFNNLYGNHKTNKTTASTTWTELGPVSWNSTSSWAPGLGRIDAIAVHPLDSNIIYAGSPNGGCWKTTNGGTTWTSLTDGQTFMKIGDVEVDSANINTVYIGTLGSGLLKSTNGGATLVSSSTGLPAGVNIRKILVSTQSSSLIFVATSSGVYKSTNAGANWTLAKSGSFYDVLIHPTNPSIVYACGNDFYKSTNGGTSFTKITSGIAASDVMRIAVTPADPNLVCIVQCAGQVFGRFYRSADAGTTFTTTVIGNPANGTNFFGYDPTGTDNAGQGGYNIDIAISPIDPNEVHIAGIITWGSVDGGFTFAPTTEWTYPNSTGYTHCDVHALEYVGNNLYVGSDGGLSVSTDHGDNFTAISNGMGVRMFYRFGCSKSNATIIATGAQDDGGSIRKSTGWIDWIGADGMESAVNPVNANIIYGSSQNGSFYKTTNGGASYFNLNTPSTSGNWTTPFVIDPNVPTTLYVGYDELYKSTNSGTTWAPISAITIGNLDNIEVAPSNSDYIYVSAGTNIYRTTDGGATWTNIAAGLSGLTINRIAVHSSSPDKVAIATSGSKVYTSTNGGANWTNITGNLPAVSARCLVYQNNANEGIYVGTNTGIYFKDNTMANWMTYNTGLPIVAVNELEIHYGTSKIRAATYGRGVWECDLYDPTAALPIAVFSSDRQIVCPGENVAFIDQSSNTPTSWNWTFQGGNPATSNSQNPSVTYNTAGTYSVSLIAYNVNGSDTASQTSYITVSPINTLPLVEGFASTTFPPVDWTTLNVNNDNIFWAYTGTAGSQGTTSSMFFNNYALNAAGKRDNMQTPKYDFTGLTSAGVTFDVAYKLYGPNDSDTLNVLISTDCGLTWTSLYLKGGTTLASVTGTQTSGIFIPAAPTDWRAESINLNAYVGQPNVMLAFQNKGDFGQAIYVDNINITGTNGISVNGEKDKLITVYPNPAHSEVLVSFNDGQLFEGNISIESVDGKLVYEKAVKSKTEKVILDVRKLSAGPYFIKINGAEGLRVKKLIIE